MLVVTRGRGQAVVIPSLGVRIVVVTVRSGGQVRVGVEAPKDTPIFREELLDQLPANIETPPAK